MVRHQLHLPDMKYDTSATLENNWKIVTVRLSALSLFSMADTRNHEKCKGVISARVPVARDCIVKEEDGSLWPDSIALSSMNNGVFSECIHIYLQFEIDPRTF